MKKNKIVGTLALMMMGSSPAFAAENKSADFQTSAQIENTCLIEADDVNFGQVYAPLTTQGTKSEMRVLCSKNTPYTIDLAYGGVYGAGGSDGGYTLEITNTTSMYEYAKLYKDGKEVTQADFDFRCASSQATITEEAVRKMLNINTPNAVVPFSVGFCTSEGTAYTNNRINLEFVNVLNAGMNVYSYGIMSGASKGDSLAYRITVPGDINKVWNSGNGSYKATATGEFEKIEVNAQIVPTNSSSLYLAQDSYTDTVTAVISY